MMELARRSCLMLVVVAAASGCPRQAPPAQAPTPVAPSPIASPLRSPSPSPARTSPRPSPSLDPSVQRRLTFKGTNDFSLEGPFTLVAGERLVRCFYDGRSPIMVILVREDGEAEAELFNRAGPFSDSARHTVAASRPYRLQITGANGPWRLEIE